MADESGQPDEPERSGDDQPAPDKLTPPAEPDLPNEDEIEDPFERDQIRYLKQAGERPILGVRLEGEKVGKRSVDVFTFGEFLAQLDRVVRGLTAGLEGISLVLKGRIPRPPDAAPWRMLALGFGRSVIVEFGLGEPERLRISDTGGVTSPTLSAVSALGQLIALRPDDAVESVHQFDDRIGNDFANLLAILADNAIESQWRTAGAPDRVQVPWESADRVRNALRAEITPVTSVERVTGFLFRLDAKTNDFKLQPDDDSQAITGHYDDTLIPQLRDAWSHRVVAELIRTEHRYAYAHVPFRTEHMLQQIVRVMERIEGNQAAGA